MASVYGRYNHAITSSRSSRDFSHPATITTDRRPGHHRNGNPAPALRTDPRHLVQRGGGLIAAWVVVKGSAGHQALGVRPSIGRHGGQHQGGNASRGRCGCFGRHRRAPGGEETYASRANWSMSIIVDTEPSAPPIQGCHHRTRRSGNRRRGAIAGAKDYIERAAMTKSRSEQTYHHRLRSQHDLTDCACCERAELARARAACSPSPGPSSAQLQALCSWSARNARVIYRISDKDEEQCCRRQIADRGESARWRAGSRARFRTLDLTMRLAKAHIATGRRKSALAKDELLYRFESERPGALDAIPRQHGAKRNMSTCHYRSQGGESADPDRLQVQSRNGCVSAVLTTLGTVLRTRAPTGLKLFRGEERSVIALHAFDGACMRGPRDTVGKSTYNFFNAPSTHRQTNSVDLSRGKTSPTDRYAPDCCSDPTQGKRTSWA